MKKLKKLTPFDAQVESLRYHITNKNAKEQRVNVSSELIKQAKEILAKRIGYSFPITNQNLIAFALLNLFSPAFQNSMRHSLDNIKGYKPLANLLASNESPELKAPQQIDRKLQQLQNSSDKHDILLESLVNAVSWLIFEHNGLDRMPIANNSDEIYAKLRQDNLKSIIDTLLRAGYNEDDRQRHLDNL